MIRPVPLKKGDTVGLIAPSSYVEREKVIKSIRVMEHMGFNVIIGDSCFQKHGYFSGTDDIRAKDINYMFANETVKGIFAIRGGYGATRLLDAIDYEVIKNNPKVFVGYSDITALHIAFNQKCDLITFHGPMPSTELCNNIDSYTLNSFHKRIFTNEDFGIVSSREKDNLEVLVEGKATGRLTGGNLSLIVSSLGTKYEIDTKDKILFIEDIDEAPYRIDRMLWQLHQAGKFRDCNGIILGAFTNCEETTKNDGLSLNEVINEIIVPYKKTTLANLKCGHCLPTLTLPLGVKSMIDGDNGLFRILE